MARISRFSNFKKASWYNLGRTLGKAQKEHSILIPAIAKKTYDRLKSDIKFRRLTSNMKQAMKTLRSPFVRAELLHREVDRELKTLFKDPLVKKHVSCEAGCTACCHTQVSVTNDEATLLARKILNKEADVNLGKLYIQGIAENEADEFYKIPYHMRACIFLNESGLCSVYDDRPAVCRTNNVVSDPVECSTEEGIEKPIRLLNTPTADMLIAGAFMASLENGTLQNMVWKALIRLKEARKDKKLANRPLPNGENSL